MYAIIRDGGRQFKVEPGQELLLDYREAAEGDTITLGDVLAVSDGGKLKVGQPALAGATVKADVLGPQQGKKLVIQKLRRRKNSRRKTGFRAIYTRVRIGEITAG